MCIPTTRKQRQIILYPTNEIKIIETNSQEHQGLTTPGEQRLTSLLKRSHGKVMMLSVNRIFLQKRLDILIEATGNITLRRTAEFVEIYVCREWPGSQVFYTQNINSQKSSRSLQISVYSWYIIAY